VESACPDGFVDAYLAENAEYYQPGLTITEIPAAEIRPSFLEQFLDGGCAVRILGISLRGTANDRDEGFVLDGDPDAIGSVLLAEGYEESSNTVGSSYDIVEDQTIVSEVSIYDIAGDGGTDTMREFFPEGTVYLLTFGS
jgi:hypothetical protein